MKKLLLAALFCGSIFSATNAQVAQPLSVGVKAGGTLATSSGDNYNMRGGFGAGVVVDYDFTKNLFLRSGIDFMMKGGKYDQKFEGLSANSVERGRKTTSIHLNYIQVPVMMGYRSDIGQGVNIYGSAGLYGAVAVYGKGRYNYTTNIAGGSKEIMYDNIDDLQFKKVDFGVVGSIGVEYQQYSINVGYEYGFLNINKKNTALDSPFTNGDSWHNMSATCTLGYKF